MKTSSRVAPPADEDKRVRQCCSGVVWENIVRGKIDGKKVWFDNLIIISHRSPSMHTYENPPDTNETSIMELR